MIISIITGIIIGIIICLYLQNFKPSAFIESFIIFGIVLSLVVFSYLAFKIGHVSFIKKNKLKFLAELLFIGIFTYVYFILIYYFRRNSIKNDHHHFINFSIVFIIIHILLEVCGVY